MRGLMCVLMVACVVIVGCGPEVKGCDSFGQSQCQVQQQVYTQQVFQPVIEQVYAMPVIQQQVYAQPFVQQQVYAAPVVQRQVVKQRVVQQNVIVRQPVIQQQVVVQKVRAPRAQRQVTRSSTVIRGGGLF